MIDRSLTARTCLWLSRASRSDDCYVLEQRAKSIRLRRLASYSTHALAKRRYFQLAYEEDLHWSRTQSPSMMPMQSPSMMNALAFMLPASPGFLLAGHGSCRGLLANYCECTVENSYIG